MIQVRPVQSSAFPRGASKFSLLVALAFACGSAGAMEALDDSSMASVNGAGIVYGLDDFSFRMAPTSYIEMIGQPPKAGSSAETYGWKRGDARYYGLSFSYGGPCNLGTGPGTGKDCTGGINSIGQDWAGNTTAIPAADVGKLLQYPIGQKASPSGSNPYGIVGFASVYNPFILRVYQYAGYDYAGNYLDQATGASFVMPTIVEFMGPSKSDPWRWAFWGLLEINRGGTCPTGGNAAYCGLKSQTIIHGTPTASGQTWVSGNTYSAMPAQRTPSILRLMQTQDTSTGAPAGARTLGINYQSALSGDFRFSVQQTVATETTPPAGTAAAYAVPSFNVNEGLYFKNVDAFMPLGILHSQALIANGSSTYDANGNASLTFQQNGNFVLELARIPQVQNVYNFAYCGATGAGAALTTCANTGGYINSPNANTHGYIRWGNWTTSNGVATGINPYTATPGTLPYDLPTSTSTANGIYFSDGAGGVTNMGISRIEGMLIQHMKISSLGAGL